MIEQFVSTVTGLAAHHSMVAYALVGLFAAVETVPVIGLAMPGSMLIVAISALVPYGSLLIWPLVVAATVGAIIGDGIAFWLGRHFQDDILALRPFRRHPQLVAQAKAQLGRHGGKTVIVARFIPWMRALVPVVAGTLGMQPWRFYAFNIASAIIWAPIHVFIGALFGASVHLVAVTASQLAVLLAPAVIAFGSAAWLARRVVLGIYPQVPGAGQRKLSHWAMARNTWPRCRLRVFASMEPRHFQMLCVAAILLVASSWLFFGLSHYAIDNGLLARGDDAIFHFLQGLYPAYAHQAMVALARMGNPEVTVPVAAGVLGWLLWRRAGRAALYWIMMAIGAVALTILLSVDTSNWLPGASPALGGTVLLSHGWGTIDVAMYGFLGLMVARKAGLAPRRRVVVIGAVAALIAFVSLSRLYLGTSPAAALISGEALGAAWVTVLAMPYVWRRA